MRHLLLVICALIFLPSPPSLAQAANSIPVDEFSDPNCEDIWARLDNFLIQLNNNPTANATISISAKHGNLASNLYFEAMMRNYLIRQKIEPNRIHIFRAQPTATREIKFWLTPPAAQMPKIDRADWSLEYAPDTKPFIFTHGESYAAEIGVCIYVDELSLLAKVLEANPGASTNVVLDVRNNRQFDSRKRRTRKDLMEYGIGRNKIRFFKRIDRKPNPHGIRPTAEYWFVP